MAHAVSKVRICNMALSNIGAKSTIENLEEGSPEANECDLWYDYSRLQALQAYDWHFARRRLTLTTHGEDPPGGVWGYRYQYPSDCVSMRKIQNPAGEKVPPVPFEIELDANQDNKTILTNLDGAVGVYTFDLETTTLFSPAFVEMLSFVLASHIAYAITGKKDIRKDMLQTFLGLQRSAPALDANERVGELPKDADWVMGRQ